MSLPNRPSGSGNARRRKGQGERNRERNRGRNVPPAVSGGNNPRASRQEASNTIVPQAPQPASSPGFPDLHSVLISTPEPEPIDPGPPRYGLQQAPHVPHHIPGTTHGASRPNNQQAGTANAPTQTRMVHAIQGSQQEQAEHMISSVRRMTTQASEGLEVYVANVVQDRAADLNSIQQDLSVKGYSSIYVPGVNIRVHISPSVRRPVPAPASRLESPESCRKRLMSLLQLHGDRVYLLGEAQHDREVGSRAEKTFNVGPQVARLLGHPEYQYFLGGAARGLGLLVHSTDRSPPQDNPHTPITSSFVQRCYNHIKQKEQAVILTFSAGACNFQDDRKHLRGLGGLLRSLCAQLISVAQSKYNNVLTLRFVDDQMEASILTEDIPVLCCVFRFLLCDFAVGLANRKREDRIYVIIDAISVLEKEQMYDDVVKFFRVLCDECEVGGLGRYIRFRYILLQPTNLDTLGPYPTERHIFL